MKKGSSNTSARATRQIPKKNRRSATKEDVASNAVGIPLDGYASKALYVESFEDLQKHEQEIGERIGSVKNGGNLFAAHPLRFLKEVGVSLSEEAQTKLLAFAPSLALYSDLAYEALKSSPYPQNVNITASSLFAQQSEDKDGKTSTTEKNS